MIRKITFRNFYSFKEEQVIDFTVNKKQSTDYFESYDGVQISKVAGFVGPNASGKTNAMRIFGFLSYFACSQDKKNDDFTPFKSYSFSNDETSSLDVEFETNDNLYQLSILLTEKTVIKESLQYKELKKGSRYSVLYERNNEAIDLNTKFFPGVTKKNLSSIPEHTSVIAFIDANYDIPLINEVHHYFASLNLNITEAGYTSSVDDSIPYALGMYTENPDVKTKMEEIVNDFGIGIDKFIFKKIDNENYSISANHKVNKKNYVLSLNYESRGTRALFCEIGRILLFLKNGSVIVSDEVETGLHPEAVNKIINFVTEKLENQKKQFIFSSHSLEFMKKFDAQQIFLVEKENNASELFRLDELKLRSEENYFKKYQSGAYGAFPKIRI